MKAAVFPKAENGASQTFSGKRITLEAPSVVQLDIGPEQVARFERDGNDLVLVLEDGTVLVIENFFVTTAEGRNDLVFEDRNGVTWWAQYGNEWTGFDIAEISKDGAATPLLLPILAGLGLAAGGAALAASGEGSSDSNEPPVAVPDAATGEEDTPVRGNVLANDRDPDSDPLTVTAFEVEGTSYLPGETATIPGVGTVTVDSDGSYTFTPESNWNGTVPTVTYTVSDGEGGSDTADLIITVAPANDLMAADDSATTDEDRPVSGTVAPNDSTTSGGDLTFTKASDPSHGTVVVNPDGTYTYTPNANYNGLDSFTYTVTDPASGESLTQTVNIIVNPATDLTAADDSATTDEDRPVSGTVAPNDNTTSGGGLIFAKASDPSHGTVVVNPDGTYTYTPNANYNGLDSFTYTVTDPASGESLTQTVNITVNPVNDAPETNGTIADQADEDAQSITTLDASTFFTDAEGDALTFSASGLPDGLTIDPATGVISGTIDRSASQDGTGGVYTVTVTASDGNGGTVDQTFTWTVTNPTPTANDDAATTDEDTPVSGNVITAVGPSDVADSDPDGDTLSVTSFTIAGDATVHDAGDTVTIAGVGRFTLGSDGSYTFTPDADWNGTVPTVTYTVSDGEGGSDTADLVITVNPVNDAPETNGTIADQADEDAQSITTLDASTFFTDAEGDALTFSASGLPDGLTIDPATGVISGTIDRSASQDGTGGVYTVTVTASDGNGGTVDQTFTWTVTNPAPIATDNSNTIDEDATSPAVGNVLTDDDGAGADSDPDGDTLNVTSFTIAGDATVHDAGDTVTIAGVGRFTLGSDGSYTFTPDADWNGTVPTVTYTVSDGEGGSDTADLVITVNPVNDAPETNGTIADQADEDAESITTLDASTFFTDAEGDALTFSASGLPDGLTIDPATGVISGTIDRSASQDGTGGVYTVTVTASDGNGAVDQTFTWTVTNPTPTANDDAATANEDTPVSGNVITAVGPGDVADSDPDGDTLSVTSFTIAGDATVHAAGDTVTIAGVGRFTLDSDGGYVFTPDADWNGTVPTVTYTVSDGEGGSDTADLVITVNPVNDVPVMVEDAQTASVTEAGNLDNGAVVPGTPSASGSFTATDADPGATQTWTVAGTPDTTYGTFSVDASGNWTYTLDNSLAATQALNEGHSIPLTYTVRVTDDAGAYAEQTVTITITGTNDAPVADADTGAVTEAGVLDGGNTVAAGNPAANGNVLTNDTDVDAGEKATLQVSGVSFGGSAGTIGSALTGIYGSLVLNSDGTYTYTLDNSDNDTQALKQGDTVTEVFTYTAVDANGATSTSTLTITVTGTNDRPVVTSTPADAAGAVTETGTGVAGTPTATGTLASSDVDADATSTWSLTTTNGTYGTIAIDPDTGVWTYTLDDTRTATQNLNAGDNPTETFTARVTDEHGAYSEQLITITVNGSNDDLTGTGAATVTLTEDGSAAGTLQDYVSDVDDVLKVTEFKVDANGDGTDESYVLGTNYTSGSDLVLTDGDGNALGTLTIDENGDYSFTPTDNYAGEVPTVTYTMAEASGGSGTVTQTIDFGITKVADAPGLQANKTVSTSEDNTVSLGLVTPVITDTGTGTGNSDYPERLGEITLTIGGAGAGGVTLSTGGMVLTPVGGTITIVLTDEPHVTNVPAENNGNGVYYLTKAQYEALQVHPAAESGRDFTVTVSVTSYEVDGTGAPVSGVTGATSTQVIDVDVQAVSDGATLTIDGGTSADLTGSEDTAIDLTSHLAATLTSSDANPGSDTDGSETYWYTVTGLPVGSVVTIDGVATTISASVTTASSAASTSETPPSITILPPPHFSGDLSGVTVTLNSRDTDGDSSGTPATITSSVTVDLHVTPVAGDVSVGNVTTSEDMAVAFLAGVAVTDTGTGAEVINSISFTVPTDWVVTAPTSSSGWSYNLTGATATITFVDNTLTEAQREAILDGFTIKPPAHSSKDETIALSITTTDSSTVNGATVSDTKTVNRDVTVTVTPVAERTNTDSDGVGGDDVTMNRDHAYSTAGREDTWFALGTNYTDASNVGGGNAQLAAPWSNADTDEDTYAVLTPALAADAPDDTVIGTQFRYSTDGGTTWTTKTYNGEPVWVPAAYLDTLQVKLPSDVSGTLTIGVQAGTRDTDPDTGVEVEDVSGSATLSMIEFDPVADAVTMALNGRATGLEDTDIPLAIKTTSSDASETFDVTISDIPNGAKIIYNGTELTVTGGSVTIAGFSNSAPLTITPPLNSNDDFTLTVSAISKDGGDSSTPVSRTIDVSVTGVADAPVVTLPAVDHSTAEATLDSSGAHKVALSALVSGVTSADTDGSEIVTVRITGLAEGFSITGATAVVSGTGEERVWVVSANNLSNVSVIVPENYSGTVNLKVAGVTTENDGDSLTGGLTDVSFTVTPSPEATITTSATLVEDEVTPLNLAIVHQNGDTNEVLGDVYVRVGYDTSTYTLHLTGTELSVAGLNVTNIGGVDYYVIPAGQLGELGAMGASNLDGNLRSLNFLYDATDRSSDGTLAAVTETRSGTLTLTATPVTDAVDASITGIAMTTATGATSDARAGDDAAPDTATVTGSGAVTVNLHVNSADTDGSEHLIRVLISGVPDGVTVTGGSQVSAGTWLLVYDGNDAQSIGSGGIDVPVEFVVGRGAVDGTSTITMTVQAQDRGDESTSSASVETDSVSWNLALDLADGGTYTPPLIEEWVYNGAAGTEDATFTLSSVIDATVSTSDPTNAYTYTVTITDLPAGSTVDGMTLTYIDGQAVYTATVTVAPGGDSQAAVEKLLASISIIAPPDSNDNNANFSFDAKLTAAAVGGTSVEAGTVADMPVTPVTDEAVVTVVTGDVDEGLDRVTATITAEDIADGIYGSIVDGKLYVQVSTVGNDGGTVSDSLGNPLALTPVSGVNGVPDGNYYVIDVGASGGSVDLVYTAAGGSVLKPGDVTFSAWAQTQETNAGNVASGTANVVIVNNGVTLESAAVTGSESALSDKTNSIELEGLSLALNDNDGSETIQSILLSGLPVGFLLYVGTSAGDATLAAQGSNAGGDGVSNTWILSSDGTLPAYVAILPPTNWSGTLSGLGLVVESGENSLSTTRVDSIAMKTVTVEAVANGLTIDPTISFGAEGHIIDLNLNASMADAAEASATVPDESIETTTLQITGLGEHAAFYVRNDLINSVSYDAKTDTYTITGLSQDDLDDLGFVQSASALTDRDAAASGLQVTVTAWTVESANGERSASVSDTLTLSVTPVLGTTGSDSFIWTGKLLDGRAGEDSVKFRYGESLKGADLEANLRNIETLDLGINGVNSISDLTPEQVQAMTDGDNRLTIRGSAEDDVTLSGDWSDNGNGTYTGTIAGGAQVTLTVEGVTATPPVAALSAGAPLMMSLGAFDETEGFGLASLDMREVQQPADVEAEPITIDEVLSSDTRGEDLTAGLPEEDVGRVTPSEGMGGYADFIDMGAPVLVPSLEDDLRSGVHYEV